METDRNASPFLPVPAAVWALVLGVLGVEAALQLGAAGLIGGPEALGWRLAWTERFGWSGALWDWAWATGRVTPGVLLRLVSFPWLHAGPWEAMLVAVLLLALGKTVGAALGGVTLWGVVLVGGAAGALAQAVIWPEARWLVGGLPAVFALVGAWLVLARAGVLADGANRGRLIALVSVLLGLRIAVGLALGTGQEWIADIAAFSTGAALVAVLRPGGMAVLLSRLRRR